MSGTSAAERPNILVRIRRLAVVGQACAGGGIALLGAATLWYCADLARFRLLVDALLPPMPMTIGFEAWLGGALTVGLVYGLFVWIMLEVANLFRLFGQGDLFGPRIERGLLRLSGALIAGVLGSVIGRVVLGLIVSWNNPPHQRQLPISVSSSDLIALLAAILFLLFARIVTEARRAIDENQSFV